MPTYEYACTSCGRRFEVVQRFSDAPLEVCEVCQGELKRVFHPVGIVLKGSGFYSTDNRSGKKFQPAKEKSEGSSGSESATKDAAKTETKTSTPSESTKKATGSGTTT